MAGVGELFLAAESLAKLRRSGEGRNPVNQPLANQDLWIIRFAHPSGHPVGVQSASALVRLKACRNDGVLQEAQFLGLYRYLPESLFIGMRDMGLTSLQVKVQIYQAPLSNTA